MSNIKLNAKDWNALSSKDQDEVTEVLRESGIISKNTAIVGDDIGGEADSTCTIACETAAAVAHVACDRFSGFKKKVCNIAVDAAERVCKNKC